MPKYICYKVVQETLTKFRLDSVESDNVAEVVRCRDCYYGDPSSRKDGEIFCVRNGCKWDADGFCSDGRRKDEQTN